MSEIPHGTMGGYTNHHCRCDRCKLATREYYLARRVPCLGCGTLIYYGAQRTGYCVQCIGKARRKPLVHGTEMGYRKKGCRCDECRAASAAARRERRATARAK